MELKKQTKNLTAQIRKKIIGSPEEANAQARERYINNFGEINPSDITSDISNIILASTLKIKSNLY